MQLCQGTNLDMWECSVTSSLEDKLLSEIWQSEFSPCFPVGHFSFEHLI